MDEFDQWRDGFLHNWVALQVLLDSTTGRRKSLVQVLDLLDVEAADAGVTSGFVQIEAELFVVFIFEAKLGSDGHHLIEVVLDAGNVNIDNHVLHVVFDCEGGPLRLRNIECIALSLHIF